MRTDRPRNKPEPFSLGEVGTLSHSQRNNCSQLFEGAGPNLTQVRREPERPPVVGTAVASPEKVAERGAFGPADSPH